MEDDNKQTRSNNIKAFILYIVKFSARVYVTVLVMRAMWTEFQNVIFLGLGLPSFPQILWAPVEGYYIFKILKGKAHHFETDMRKI